MTSYLQKHAFLPAQISDLPNSDLSIVVVIPCHDEPDAVASLQALRDCTPPSGSVEVIIVINSSETDTAEIKQQNKTTQQQIEDWIPEHTDARFRCFVLYHPDLPKKHAGVGLARKIGMDEAVRRFEQAGHPQGVIACFDADSGCAENYLEALEDCFGDYDAIRACSIYYEHPTSGTDYPPAVYRAIVEYELYLRYYVNALRFADFPYAYQTIGSSMAVRADAYQRQGGMNRRKAGEDFYFLHKFIPLGSFVELTETTVIPSPRPSHRVPFGTGKAIQDMLDEQGGYLAYHPDVFVDLKMFLDKIDELHDINEAAMEQWTGNLPDCVLTFLLKHDFYQKIKEIQRNTSSWMTFRRRFFRWFSAFMVLKYVHHARDGYYPSIPIREAAAWLAGQDEDIPDVESVLDLLQYFREQDRW